MHSEVKEKILYKLKSVLILKNYFITAYRKPVLLYLLHTRSFHTKHIYIYNIYIYYRLHSLCKLPISSSGIIQVSVCSSNSYAGTS